MNFDNEVYIRSFSKTFMLGVIIGAAIIPESLIESVMSLKYLSDISTSTLTQVVLNIFIKSGMYEKHIKKLKKSLKSKV